VCAVLYVIESCISNRVQGSVKPSIGTTAKNLHTLYRSLSAYYSVIASASRRQQIAKIGVVFQFSTRLPTRWKQLVV